MSRGQVMGSHAAGLCVGSAAALALGCLLPPAARAETADAPPAATYPTIPVSALATSRPPPENLETLTVVGSRHPVAAAAVPGSLSLVSARDMAGAQASSLGEALAQVPGVSVEGGPRANAEFLNLRGLSGPRVLLVVDGARQNFLGGHRSSLLVDPALLQQVEVLRGPASALWGSDALGGVVALRTKDADDFLHGTEGLSGRARYAYESATGERLGMLIGVGRHGSFDAVASQLLRQADDYQRPDGAREPHSGQQVDARLFKLSWLPEEGPHELRLIGHGFRQDSLSPSNPATRVSDTNPLLDRRNDTRYQVLRYRFAREPEDFSADFSLYSDELAIREDRVDEPRADRTRFRTRGLGGHLYWPVSLAAWPWLRGLTIGGDGFRDAAAATRNGEPRSQYPNASRNMLGGFVQTEFGFGRWSVLPGLRYDHYTAESHQDDSAGVSVGMASPKLGLLWQLAESASLSLRLHAALNTAFRAPGLIEIYAAGQHFLGNDFVPNPNLRPEQARNLELGLTADWHTAIGTLQAQTAIYQNRIRDYIELQVSVESTVPAPQCVVPRPPPGCVNQTEEGLIDPTVPPVHVGGRTSSENLPAATIQGAELALNWSLGPWRSDASYTLTRGEADDSGMPLASIPADRLRLAGGFAPTCRLQLQLSYTHHLAQRRVPTFVDEEGNTQPVLPPTAAHGVWNAHLSWEPAGAAGEVLGLTAPRLILGVDNLRNADYRHHLNVLPSPGRNLRVSLAAGF